MEYQVGQTYELTVVGEEIRKDRNGIDYILVEDVDNHSFPIYQILKCQYDEGLPNTLYVKCIMHDAFGRYRFVQDVNKVYAEHYTTDKLWAFDITDIKEDNNVVCDCAIAPFSDFGLDITDEELEHSAFVIKKVMENTKARTKDRYPYFIYVKKVESLKIPQYAS